MIFIRIIWNRILIASKRIGVFFKWLFSGEEKIAIVGLFVTIILFGINYFQIREIRNQERDDFYAINSSILEIKIINNEVYNSEEDFERIFARDTGMFYCDIEIVNKSNFPCEMLGYTVQIILVPPEEMFDRRFIHKDIDFSDVWGVRWVYANNFYYHKKYIKTHPLI